MCKILILYHSQTGNTERMAENIAKGASSIKNVEPVLKKASEATLKNLLECDGLAVGSPEYFGYMAGMIKDYFDRTYEDARGRKEIFKKPYAVFISAGNDGTGALNSIERICIGYQLKKVYEPVLARGGLDQKTLSSAKNSAKPSLQAVRQESTRAMKGLHIAKCRYTRITRQLQIRPFPRLLTAKCILKSTVISVFNSKHEKI